MAPNDNALVTKHNKLVEARYSLSLQEQRLVLWIVSQIEPDDDILTGFTIPIKELAKFLGVEKNKNLYSEMKDITRGLVTKLIEIDDLEKDRTVQTAWLSEAEYKYGEGMVQVNMSPTLRGYLIGLKEQFTTYSLRIAVSLKSSYAIRMYELLMQYKTIGERVIEIEDLRTYLGLKPEQYSKYSMFKKRTIEISQKEINAKSDIYFEFEEIKKGRKVASIRFIIKRNADYGEVVKLPLGDQTGVQLVDRLKTHGVNDQTAWRIVHAYIETDPERISWHIAELEAQLKAGKAVKSPAGWVVKAIDTDHRPQKTLFQQNTEQAERQANSRRKEREKQERAIERLENLISAQSKSYRLYVGSEIDKWRESLSEAEFERIRGVIEVDIEKDFAKKDFKRHPWGSLLNQTRVRKYLEASEAPLPYRSEDEFFKAEGKPLMAELEAKLSKLKAQYGE